MSNFNFVEKVMCIGGNGTPDLQFYKRGFNLDGTGSQPSWQDIILSGNTALTLTNALANRLNYVKLFGGTKQNGTPSPNAPIDIVSNNGVLKVSKNLFDKYTAEKLYGSIQQSGSIQYFNTPGGAQAGCYEMKIEPNTQYTLSIAPNDTTIFRILSLSSKWDGITTETGTLILYGTTETQYTFTTPNNASYIYFQTNYAKWETVLESVQLEKGSTATSYIPYGQIYTDGTQETVEVDTTGDTAIAENLFKVDTYQDEQSVIDGSVTRNIGIRVFDGTENWQSIVSPYFSLAKSNITPSTLSGDNFNSICSHFVRAITGTILTEIISFYWGKSYLNVNIDPSGATTVNQFKQFLATQYANGTPVILVYPLAEPTTETVTAQPLTIQAGTNIITAEGSIDNLPLEVSYKATT